MFRSLFPSLVLVCGLAVGTAVAAEPDGATPPAVAQPAMSDLRRTITEFGAVGDRRTLNTEAIQQAIDAVAAAGGGVVEIPRGVFRSGSIFLKPGAELFLADGAVLLGSNRLDDYPKRPTRIEGHTEPWRMALINAEKMNHVRIGGRGRVDGNGIMFWAAFWQRVKEGPGWTNLGVERPRLMYIADCSDVRIEGLSLQDSGFWNIHLYRCRDVLIEGVRIKAPTRGGILGPSTDGIDIDSSQNVTVRRCHISVNDDNIALKGSKGPLADQDKDSPPVENIVVEDCEFGDGSSMITCGSEATTVRNVTVRNVTITGKNRVLTLKLRPDTPQHYEHILIDGVKLGGGVGRILHVTRWMQFFDLQGHPPPSRQVADVVIRNVTGDYAEFGQIIGNSGDTIRDIRLENFDVKLGIPELRTRNVQNLVFKNVKVNGAEVHSSVSALIE